MNSKAFVNDISRYRGKDVFNPYSDICETFDRPNANKISQQNLRKVIDSLSSKEIDAIWIGRDLGHRGGRRTGIALTDEANFDSAFATWQVELELATIGDVFKERTAENIWKVLRVLGEKRVFMWNVFPFHPHEEGVQLSNRSHTAKERDVGLEILHELVRLMQPKQLIAIGNDAFNCAVRIFERSEVYKVRHPSYGGEKVFAKQK